MNAKGKTHRRRHGPPGDPELLTLKAVRALEAADVVAHFAKRGNSEQCAPDRSESHLKPGGDRAALALFP